MQYSLCSCLITEAHVHIHTCMFYNSYDSSTSLIANPSVIYLSFGHQNSQQHSQKYRMKKYFDEAVSGNCDYSYTFST